MLTAHPAIRPLRPGDRPAWQALWTEYLAFYRTSVETEVYDTAFSRLLSDDAREFQGLIGLVDNRPVGLAHFLFHRSLWSIGDTCYLMDLYVAPQARRHGVGRALIEAVHATAQRNDIETTYWTTEKSNTTARALYDTLAVRTPFIVYEKQS